MNARSTLLLGVVLASLGALGGCKSLLKKKTDDPAASATAAVASAPVVPVVSAVPVPEVVPPPVALDEATIPAPQDFEDEAATAVTTANFKTEFARIQKEVGP